MHCRSWTPLKRPEFEQTQPLGTYIKLLADQSILWYINLCILYNFPFCKVFYQAWNRTFFIELIYSSWKHLHSKLNLKKINLGESEDVVNEKKHVLSLLVTEVLGYGESGQGNTGTGARGLVHLSVDQSDLYVLMYVCVCTRRQG